MVTCCVPSCKNTLRKNGDISFHQFPKDKKTRDAWISIIFSNETEKETGWVPPPRAMVCGKHFAPECFNLSATRRTLIPRSVPTIFDESSRKRRQTRRKSNKKKRRRIDDDYNSAENCDSGCVIQQECDSTSVLSTSKDVAVQVNTLPVKPSKKKTIIIKIGLIKRQRKTITKLKAHISALKEALKAHGTNV